MKKEWLEAKQKLGLVDKILIISHKKPDADTLGAAIALRHWLVSDMAKSVDLACVDQPGQDFNFMTEDLEFLQEFNADDYDLMIFVDSGAYYMSAFHLKYPDLFDDPSKIMNIDHHASNDFFGEINVVDENAASTTEILYKMFMAWEVYISEDIATALLAGIYGDTGSFMHSNTTQEVLQVAADLVARGAMIDVISKNLFNRNRVPALKLWGRVLERARVTHDNVVVSVIKEQDYDAVGADPGELSGVVDYLNMVPGSRYAVLLNEDKEGNVKGSMRTRNADVDLSRIAAVFGGGGHPKASGFTMPGRVEEVVSYGVVSSDKVKKSLDF